MTNSPKKSPAKAVEKPVFFGFAVEVWQRGRNPRLKFRWGRITALLTLLLSLGYGTFCGALFWFYKERRQFDEITVAQVITWPFKRAEFRQRMGEYFIERSREEFDNQNFAQGFYFLRAGVSRAPADLDARKLLAEFYEFGFRRTDQAMKVLEEGIPYAGSDIDYLRLFISMLLRNQEDARVIDFAEKHLAEPGELAYSAEVEENSQEWEQLRWQALLAYSTAQSYYFRGNYDRAESILGNFGLPGTHDAILLQAMIQWQRGQRNLAVKILESGLERYPESDNYLLQLTRFYRDLDQPDTARRYAILRAINSPDNPRPRIDLLYSFNQMGDTQREVAEINGLIQKYSDNEEVLLLIGNFAADTGQQKLARRVYNLALQQNNAISTFALLVIEAQIVSGDYDEAIRFCEELVEEEPAWLPDRMPTFNSLRAVAYYGTERVDLGQLYLNDLLASRELRSETLIAVSRRLEELGLFDESGTVLRDAFSRNPNNQAALTGLIQVNLKRNQTETIPELVSKLLEMRRPSYSLLEAVYAELGRDRYLFTEEQESLLAKLKRVLEERTA